jgi:hypothetical protein
MAHFAEIDNAGVVLRVLVVPNEEEDRGQAYLADDLGLGGIWKRTSYNTRANVHLEGGTPYRKNFAGIGYTYDSEMDAFIPPKLFPSWLFDEETCSWYPPEPMPIQEGTIFTWDESRLRWVAE